MHNISRTSSVAALGLFVVVSLVAALAIAWPNLARAHSVAGAALTRLTVSPGTLTPAFSRTVHHYVVPVADGVTQITIAARPDGDGTVAYEEADGTALPDADTTTSGQQVDLSTDGKRVNVVVTHDDAGEVIEETYGVLVIREGPEVQDTIVLMALYESTDGPNWGGGGNLDWTDDHNWGSTVPIGDWAQVNTDADGRVTYLALWDNNLSGTLPAELGNLDQLTELPLQDNHLTGSIPDLGRLTNLTLLRMGNNELTGEIPASLSNLTKLRYLELWENQLTGPIPDLSRLTDLTFLDLHDNQLSGTIPSMRGLTKLEEIRLQENRLSGPIPDLSGLTSLERLYLDNNQLSGEIPASLDSLTSLLDLYLDENQLTGEIPASLGNFTKLTQLFLGGNQLTGTIPASLGNLTTLRQLGLNGNQLTGKIPASLGNLTNLLYLYLNDNQLSGPIPDLNRLTNLLDLYLWGNRLSGEIPDWLGNLTNLQSLIISQNQLSGEIPNSLRNLRNLYYLYLNNNQLSGGIPAWLGDLTNLYYLYLYDNQLSGEIPDSLDRLTNLQQLYLSGNQLSGTIPNLSGLTNLQRLYLWGNQLSGTIPNLSSLTNLQQLYLYDNQLSGPIPDWLGGLTYLRELYLSSNQLSGEIPPVLGDLTNLKSARFASNTDADGNPSLTGCVPHELRYLVAADEFAPDVPAHDFIAVDANGDGDTDDPDDIPGLNLPFCMVSALDLSDVTLDPSFVSGTAVYTADVFNEVQSTTVTATLADSNDRLSIRKDANSYTSGDAVPLDVGSNMITIEITPSDATPKQTYTVRVLREGSVESDRAALVALYKSAGGSGWTDKTNWNSEEPLTNWFGVTVFSHGRVEGLDLSANNLRGTLPAELGSLTILNELDLSENQLRGTIPDWRGLTLLAILNLGDNQLSGSIPDWLGSLTALHELYLRDNRLTGTIPEELGDLGALRYLYLDDNQLSGAIPEWPGEISQLQQLYLNGNQLSGCVPDRWRDFLLTNHDFIALDANGDGDAADPGDTPGLPFCTLSSLAFSDDVTLNPAFTGRTTTYTASAPHDVALMVVTATLHDRDGADTITIMKGADPPGTPLAGGVVFVSVPLDVGPNVLTLTATPAVDPLTPHTYTVTVTRAPNAPPAFDEGAVATRGVAENTAEGENIGDPVAATDADGDNDTLTYSLDAAGAESFDIDASSGQLRTKAGLDYETRDSYRVTVSVSDGVDANSDPDETTDNTIAVTILVSNVNEAPEFPSSADSRSIPESTPVGGDVGAPFTATDGDNDTRTYSLDETGAESFSIDAASGQLRTRVALDVEEGDTSYTVTVTAADPSNEAASVVVTITVTNVDEAGTVTLSKVQPLVGRELEATVTDPDYIVGRETWSWESSSNRSSWTPINGADTEYYRPVAGDVGRYLRATASYDDDEGTGKSASAVSVNPVRTRTPGNTAPQFDSSVTGDRNVDENTPAGMDIGEPVEATDADNDTLTYTLDPGEDGAEIFDIVATTGQLRTKAALDFETAEFYYVRVTATDTAGGTAVTSQITINLDNVEEPGTVTLSSLQPIVGQPLTATVSDPDDSSDSETWSWARSPNGTTSWTPIGGETSDTYTPATGDMGRYLRATASYTDEVGPDKSAQAISANAVEAAPGRNPPVLREHPTATRSVPRNTPAGRNIGAPLSATDADNDALTYSLGGPDWDAFDIAASSGQLQTKAPLDRRHKTSYTVFVSVSDGKDDLGTTETPPQIDTTTAVTITVTTPRSRSRSGGGGGGGSSRRATPTPTPTPSPTPTPTGPQFSGVIAAEPSVTATVVPEGTTLGVNGGGDLPGGVYVNFPPAAVALPVQVSVSVSNAAPSDLEAPSGTTLLPLTINITPETPLTLGTPLTIEINPTPEQLEAAGGDLNHLAVGVVTPNGIVVLPTQVMHGRLVVTIDHLSTFVLVAITDPVPVLRQPPMGDASSMGPLLQWTQPPETTWFQVQVIPFNEDGPGINLVIGDGALVQAAQYQVMAPNFGSADPNYVLLPDMTYLWRVRTSTVLTNPTEADWSAWAASSFRTPPASSSTITRVAPALFGEVSTLTPTLTWANSNPVVFYYEVQVSRDFEFGPNAFLYSEYVHGGASTPPNSYVVPEAFPLEAGAIYYWRVRPRIQGDGDPLPWSRINVFQTPG